MSGAGLLLTQNLGFNKFFDNSIVTLPAALQAEMTRFYAEREPTDGCCVGAAKLKWARRGVECEKCYQLVTIFVKC